MTPTVLAHGSGILAHQSGWDEIAFFVLPVLAIYLAIRLVKARHGDEDETAPDTADSDRPPD
ncbi:MAG: hypothetical protein ACRDUY_12995 [Nitriliruptorales bacterium]